MKIDPHIFSYLKKYSCDPDKVNKLIVSCYIEINSLNIETNAFIKKLILKENEEESSKINEFVQLFKTYCQCFTIEELIELFEFVISPEDKEVNGAVYTPKYIRDYIVKETIAKYTRKTHSIAKAKLGDLACGCGGFFITIADEINKLTNKSFFEIYRDNLFGLDIQAYSIERSRILLTLYAISKGEDYEQFEFNLYQGNALNFDWDSIKLIKENKGFDIIVGNPPYVGASKIDEESKKLLVSWSVSSSGKPDLYIPFFEIGMENLNSFGVLGYITVNTFYKSLNGRSVRQYFSRNEFAISIVDFGGEQLFRNRSTYTCICIIGKQKSLNVRYAKSKSDKINALKVQDFIEIPYDQLNDFEGWYLIADTKKNMIIQIENTGTPLGEKFEIRNGFATLRNDVYVFKPVNETDDFYFLEKEGIEFKIEKSICRNAIKPNILKSELGIQQNTEKLIFPYYLRNGETDLFNNSKYVLQIIDEQDFKSKFPNAFYYLTSYKKSLSQRDKGKRKYEKWYVYGRNQALMFHSYKLLFPYISSEPYFVFTDDKDLLFYNGYAVLSESIEELYILQKILMSKIFWFYIKNTSKPYSGEYFSLAKNYIKNFGICDLTDAEKRLILSFTDENEIDTFLMKKYDIQIE